MMPFTAWVCTPQLLEHLNEIKVQLPVHVQLQIYDINTTISFKATPLRWKA